MTSNNQFYTYLVRLNEYERRKKYANTLGITLEELKDRWNEFIHEFNFSFKIKEVEIQNEVTFSIKITQNIFMLGTITTFDNENIIRNITLTGSGNGTPQSGSNILISIAILIATLNPNEHKDFRKEIYRTFFAENSDSNINKSIIINGITYKLKVSKQIGVWFTIKR